MKRYSAPVHAASTTCSRLDSFANIVTFATDGSKAEGRMGRTAFGLWSGADMEKWGAERDEGGRREVREDLPPPVDGPVGCRVADLRVTRMPLAESRATRGGAVQY